MKTKIKRHSRSVISVLLAVCMLVSCMTVGLITTDAAKVDSESVGYNTYYVKGTWDEWVLHDITSTAYPVELNANTTYSFVFMADGDQFASNTTIKGSTDYNFSKNANVSITLQTVAVGIYTFSYKGMDGGQTSMSVHIEYPVDTTPTTWTAVGDNTAIFGTAWTPTITANDLTKDGDTWSKTWSGVQLSDGTIKYKVAKNHAWTVSYPSSDASKTVDTAGLYNVTVTYNESTNAVDMELVSAATYNLTVPTTVNNAVVKATYNGVTANEGETLEDIPTGASVTISVTPDTGYKCTGITSTPEATISGSGKTWTLTMPSANVTNLTFTLDSVGTKTVYFNNVNTEYSMVSAYVDYNGGKPLGSYPGQTMTKLANSNIWSISVPSDATDITFIGDNGYNTDTLTIPDSTNPMYTAGSTKSSPATGGTWGTYIARTNEITVSKGSTLNNSNLFTGITATMYDYYTDGEVTNGWLSGIGDREYSKNDGSQYEWNPFTKFNDALDAYARDKGVTYPLYFGNLNTTNGGADLIKVKSGTYNGQQYYNWNYAANNSNGLGGNTHNAVTGLTGQTIQNNNSRYYKAGATNENGAAMAFFDEDFLSGANSQNKALATILRTSAFPVRKTNEGGTASISKIYLVPGEWSADSAVYDVWFNGANQWAQMTESNGKYVANVPAGATTATFVRRGPAQTRDSWDSGTYWSQSGDITLATSGSDLKNVYTFSAWDGGDGKSTFTPSLDTSLSGYDVTGGHDLYVFDSTGGKDNAYITNIDKDNKTAQIDYYYDSNKVYAAGIGSNSGAGFFPFDYNNILNNIDTNPHDLGFGMKLEIPFTLNANGLNSDNTHQEFKFSGDDDLWVYVDGKLVLDLGGAHLQSEGTIDFNTETVSASHTQAVGSAARNGSFADWFDNTNPNTVHTMTIYYMERGMYDSNLQFSFSFHAIPNQLKTEKKVRTANVNSGFYILNPTTQSDYTVDNNTRYVTWFEKSYQYENFNVTQTSGTAPKTPGSVQYTMDRAPGSTQAGSTLLTAVTEASNQYQLGYTLRNDFTAYFMDQYAAGTSITLKEASHTSNLYKYTPSIAVYDDANNGSEVTGTGDATDGYTFDFAETHPTGIENLNIRARFTNQMITHDLYVYKQTNVTDTNTSFTLNIQIKADSTEYTAHGYTAYPLYCTIDGEDTQLSVDGNITIKAGQELIIPKIPENVMVQITESLGNDSAYAYMGTDLAYTSGAAASAGTSVTNGVQFAMGTADMKATVRNGQSDPVILSHQLKPGSVGTADTYVTAVVTDTTGATTKATYAKTTGRITVDPQYIKKNSTDKIVITLETTPIDAFAFEHFWEQIGSLMNQLDLSGTPYTAVIEEDQMKATVTVVIGDLFNGTGAQLYTELPFYSSLLDLQRTLTVTKKLTSGTDSTSSFEINITKDGTPYSGNYKLNGADASTTTGVITVHQNDVITVEGLHVGENVAVFETNIPFNYQFSKATLGADDDTNVASGTSTGYAYTVSENTALTIWNAPITYHYSIYYNYSSYRNLHDMQKYKVTGDFDVSSAIASQYLEQAEVEDADSKTNPKAKVTAYWFKGDDERKNFINILGPYENNFMKKISWNTNLRSDSNSSGVNIRYNSSTHTYTIDVNANIAENNEVDLKFVLPYDYGAESQAYGAVAGTDGKVSYDPSQPSLDIPNLNYGSWFAVNGVKYGETGKPQFVSAPLVIYNGDQAMGFKYWTVKTVATDLAPSVEYTKCYYHEFNLSIYQDSIVEPHYENITAEEAANYSHNAHEEAIKAGNANGAVVTFIENSRNQYNMRNQNIKQDSRKQQGDRIYTDFLLSYASEGDLKFQDYANGTYTAGLAIQKVALLDDDAGGKNTDSAHYATKYGATLGEMKYDGVAFDKTTLESFIKGNVDYDDAIGLERSEFDANKLDNKNRIQYYYSYSVRSHTNLTDNGNKDYVYRAFAYMKDNSGNVTMVSQPLYFTFYDMASIANAQIGYNADFPSTPTP